MFERFTERARRVVDLSQEEAHVLLGLIREGEGVAAQVPVKLGTKLSHVRQRVIETLSGYDAHGCTRPKRRPPDPGDRGPG